MHFREEFDYFLLLEAFGVQRPLFEVFQNGAPVRPRICKPGAGYEGNLVSRTVRDFVMTDGMPCCWLSLSVLFRVCVSLFAEILGGLQLHDCVMCLSYGSLWGALYVPVLSTAHCAAVAVLALRSCTGGFVERVLLRAPPRP